MEFMDEQSRFEHGCIGRDLPITLGNIAFLGLFLLPENEETEDE